MDENKQCHINLWEEKSKSNSLWNQDGYFSPMDAAIVGRNHMDADPIFASKWTYHVSITRKQIKLLNQSLFTILHGPIIKWKNGVLYLLLSKSWRGPARKVELQIDGFMFVEWSWNENNQIKLNDSKVRDRVKYFAIQSKCVFYIPEVPQALSMSLCRKVKFLPHILGHSSARYLSMSLALFRWPKAATLLFSTCWTKTCKYTCKDVLLLDSNSK